MTIRQVVLVLKIVKLSTLRYLYPAPITTEIYDV